MSVTSTIKPPQPLPAVGVITSRTLLLPDLSRSSLSPQHFHFDHEGNIWLSSASSSVVKLDLEKKLQALITEVLMILCSLAVRLQHSAV
jgi:hypothetical protein